MDIGFYDDFYIILKIGVNNFYFDNMMNLLMKVKILFNNNIDILIFNIIEVFLIIGMDFLFFKIRYKIKFVL